MLQLVVDTTAKPSLQVQHQQRQYYRHQSLKSVQSTSSRYGNSCQMQPLQQSQYYASPGCHSQVMSGAQTCIKQQHQSPVHGHYRHSAEYSSAAKYLSAAKYTSCWPQQSLSHAGNVGPAKCTSRFAINQRQALSVGKNCTTRLKHPPAGGCGTPGSMQHSFIGGMHSGIVGDYQTHVSQCLDGRVNRRRQCSYTIDQQSDTVVNNEPMAAFARPYVAAVQQQLMMTSAQPLTIPSDGYQEYPNGVIQSNQSFSDTSLTSSESCTQSG